jgi:hypothetical protein
VLTRAGISLARLTLLVATLVFFTGAAARSRADVYELNDGGQIVGELVERSDRGVYVIRTPDGVETTIDRSQLKRLVVQDETALEYQRRSRSAADTAEAHRALAAWCREHDLPREADHHLRRVIELDPDDDEARRSLDFQRVGDRWLNREDLMRVRGFVLFEGEWRSPQDVAIRQRDATIGDSEASWFVKLRRWRGWLDNRREERVAEAQGSFAAINDSQAAPALVKLLDDEEDDWAFDIMLAALGRLDHPLAIQTLVAYSLEYEHTNKARAAEVRLDCLGYLTGRARPVSILPYVQALKDKDNLVVNRAGEALRQLGDPAAISPLIDALVTTHKYEISAGNPGQMQAGFSPSGTGGGGLSMGGNGPKIEPRDEENIRVHNALVKLSGGQNFDYDELAWRHWYVELLSRQHANARRDE